MLLLNPITHITLLEEIQTIIKLIKEKKIIKNKNTFSKQANWYIIDNLYKLIINNNNLNTKNYNNNYNKWISQFQNLVFKYKPNNNTNSTHFTNPNTVFHIKNKKNIKNYIKNIKTKKQIFTHTYINKDGTLNIADTKNKTLLNIDNNKNHKNDMGFQINNLFKKTPQIPLNLYVEKKISTQLKKFLMKK